MEILFSLKAATASLLFLASFRNQILDMVMIVVTLILGAIFVALFLIPRAIKSGDAKVVQTNPSSKVYDVTPYVEEHPGGDAILVHAGDDSTEGFFGPQHATRVFDMVDEFYIGDLKR
ncbi:cytochrome b5 isoform X3 [Magnolia sinica]|uniref:cytochrome b5 isoform X3 n=1 Tax=Magnolia sinica TaxID=86752 RepID=UPI002658ABE6|nr:cytochrome b5 isoform X3 [Magnolia sinica]